MKRLKEKPNLWKDIIPGRMGVPKIGSHFDYLSGKRIVSWEQVSDKDRQSIMVCQQNTETCAFSSLASALYAMNDQLAHKTIKEHIDDSLWRDPFGYAVELL